MKTIGGGKNFKLLQWRQSRKFYKRIVWEIMCIIERIYSSLPLPPVSDVRDHVSNEGWIKVKSFLFAARRSRKSREIYGYEDTRLQFQDIYEARRGKIRFFLTGLWKNNKKTWLKSNWRKFMGTRGCPFTAKWFFRPHRLSLHLRSCNLIIYGLNCVYECPLL